MKGEDIMACSNGCGCTGSLNSLYANAYAPRNTHACPRNSYMALERVHPCGRHNYPYYTGICPDRCGCYRCGCNAGVNVPFDRRNACGNCNDNCACNDCGACSSNCACADTCGCNNDHACGNDCGHCHHHNHCGCHGGCLCGADAYGMFTACAPLCLGCGTEIPLTASAANSDGFSLSGGMVTISKPGRYLALCSFSIPADASVDAAVSLNVNGVPQPSARMDLSGGTSCMAQAVFSAEEGTAVCLSGSRSCGIPGIAGQNIVTLILIRIG